MSKKTKAKKVAKPSKKTFGSLQEAEDHFGVRIEAPKKPAEPQEVSIKGVTVKDSAEYLGCTEQNVAHLLAVGHLHGEKFGRIWLVNLDSLRAYKSSEYFALADYAAKKLSENLDLYLTTHRKIDAVVQGLSSEEKAKLSPSSIERLEGLKKQFSSLRASLTKTASNLGWTWFAVRKDLGLPLNEPGDEEYLSAEAFWEDETPFDPES